MACEDCAIHVSQSLVNVTSCIQRFVTKNIDWNELMSFNDVSFFDIPWEDVLCKYILSGLSLEAQFRLRTVSRQWLELITLYFSIAKSVNTTDIADRLTRDTLIILVKDTTRLRELVIPNANEFLDDKLLISVLSNNQGLRKLDISNYRPVSSMTNSCLNVLALNCAKISHISLRRCIWLRTEGISFLSLNCRNIEFLDLTECWLLDDEAIILIALNCKKLKWLSVAKIYSLTDTSISILGQENQTIEFLDLRECFRISDESIRNLAIYANSLEELHIGESKSITENTISLLRRRGIKISYY